MAKKLFNSGFKDWKPSQLPDLTGRCYVITGGNSGIGLEAAKMLGEAGGNIIIACRNPSKAKDAQSEISAVSKGTVETIQLDLASLESVRKIADELRSRVSKIDGLINNAGIMQTPEQRTADGFEMQIGTNHLGHFLWTGLLFDLVEAASGRIVIVSSVAHKFGKINFDDLMSEKKYSSTMAYCQSKLANLIFAMDLDRKLKAKNSSVSVYACHPGYSATNLQSTGPTGLFKGVYKLLNAIVAQPMKNGAMPTVLCAAGKEAKPGGYYGPQGLSESRGRISDAVVMPQALEKETAEKLWQESEKYVNLEWTV
jgi:NAD(P)-dependent dehydrogenase (short-subunit alcohol dehydrogenase family)